MIRQKGRKNDFPKQKSKRKRVSTYKPIDNSKQTNDKIHIEMKI